MSQQDPWSALPLRTAWARRDYGAVLQEYRRAAGISQTAIGALVGLAQADVSLYERGRHTMQRPEVIQRLTEGLRVPPELLGISANAMTEWLPDPDLAERVARAHSVGCQTDTRDADRLARLLAEHRRAEDEEAGVKMWPIVRGQLEAVTLLLPGSSGTTADKLLLLAAEHAHWLSWVAHGQGHGGPAKTWLDLAHGWALDAGSADMASWITRVRAYYQLGAGDPVRALRTSAAASRAAHELSPGAAAIARHTEAMAAAAVGERDRARRLAEQAYRDALRAPDEDQRPGWLYWLSPTRAKLLLGEAAHAAHDWSTAADALGQGVAELDREYPRDAAFYRARLADAERRR